MAKLKSNLSAYADLAKEVVKISLEETGSGVTTIIRRLAPVDTGDLKRSYTWTMPDSESIIIGSNQFQGVYARGYPTYYAPDVEFGYQHKPKPHFLPGWTQAERIFVSRFKANLREL
jgi:hypothetical protein